MIHIDKENSGNKLDGGKIREYLDAIEGRDQGFYKIVDNNVDEFDIIFTF